MRNDVGKAFQRIDPPMFCSNNAIMVHVSKCVNVFATNSSWVSYGAKASIVSSYMVVEESRLVSRPNPTKERKGKLQPDFGTIPEASVTLLGRDN